MKPRAHLFVGLLIAWLLQAQALPVSMPRTKEAEPATALTISTGIPKCQIDVDGSPAGATNSQGTLATSGVQPGGHYIHADCPDKPEIDRFVTILKKQSTKLDLTDAGSQKAITPLEAAESKMRLREMVVKAVQLRASEQFEEAVSLLRRATVLDPSNSDLHRELGITFLLAKDWESAGVEMTEAIRHDPEDADAHNGLGYAFEKMGNLQGALAEYHMATRLDPSDDSYREHYYEVMTKLAVQRSKGKKP